MVEQARRANPALEIVARAHSDDAVEHLTGLGADLAVMGEREIARRMLDTRGRAAGRASSGERPSPRVAVRAAPPRARLVGATGIQCRRPKGRSAG